MFCGAGRHIVRSPAFYTCSRSSHQCAKFLAKFLVHFLTSCSSNIVPRAGVLRVNYRVTCPNIAPPVTCAFSCFVWVSGFLLHCMLYSWARGVMLRIPMFVCLFFKSCCMNSDALKTKLEFYWLLGQVLFPRTIWCKSSVFSHASHNATRSSFFDKGSHTQDSRAID